MFANYHDILKYSLLITFLYLTKAIQFSSSTRKLSYEYNPGCESPQYSEFCSNNTQLNLIHIKANGSEDVLHFLWSTWKLPTVIIAMTSLEAELDINWMDLYSFQEGALSFSEPPLYSIGLVIQEVWEFADPQDDVSMGMSPSVMSANLSSLDWGDVNASIIFEENLMTAFPKSSNEEELFSKNGSFGVKFSAAGEEATSGSYPHLMFTGNSTQIQIVFNNLVAHAKSRFAVELVALSTHPDEKLDWQMMEAQSISDETSPGVFSFVRLKTPCDDGHFDCQGVLSWKPVSYNGPKPSVANSSDAVMTSTNSSTYVAESIATSYFKIYSNVSQKAWNMTFGTTGDGYFAKTRYASWTLMVGVGSAISQGLSLAAIITIAIGLGLPLVLMVLATVYLGVTQCCKKDDELFLSQNSMN